MLVCTSLLLLLPLAIGTGLLAKSIPVLEHQSFFSLLSSAQWSPMEEKFGFYPFIISSVMVTVLSFAMAGPICLLAAIYLTQYARPVLLRIMHPVIDILAGIPSVVYGVWGILVIVPLVADYIAPLAGSQLTGYSILAGGIVLAVMCIPYMLNLLIEVFRNIPRELNEASLSLGATRWETIKFVLVRKGMTGIISAFGLGISKALGETIAVLMVVGNVVQVPGNLLEAGYPLPALIANNYGEMMSIPLYDSALMLSALVLFLIIFLFNSLSRYLIYKTELT
ncbi:phosphate ABC transporter permease subunit PstC [Anseongella ginsenosidimutans]|nr:phosphate ABC transporter permease subunit PstC [Anseongella ginsenosidimutans]